MGERGLESYIVERVWDFCTDVHNVNAKTNFVCGMRGASQFPPAEDDSHEADGQ